MNNLFNNVYKDKKVLITGHTGFKGSWLSLWLTNLGAEVIGYSIDIPSNPSHFELLKLDLISITGDITNEKELFEVIDGYKPDIIFHLAAQPLVLQSYKNPVKTFKTNIFGTINLLESCRKIKTVKAIINITSDKCYKNKEIKRGYRENDSLGGDDPYSASKGAVEIISNSYRKSFFNLYDYKKNHSTLLANVRAGNVIGGGDWANYRLIPDIVKATSENKLTIIRNPQAIRPWQHILEPLSGYLHLGWKLLEGKKEFADNWNFGPNEENILTVKELTEQTKKYWDKIRYKIILNIDKLHEANLLSLDSSKARQFLNWKNIWDGHKTFKKTINWYKNYYENNIILSKDDLDEYINDAKQSSVEWAKN